MAEIFKVASVTQDQILCGERDTHREREREREREMEVEKEVEQEER